MLVLVTGQYSDPNAVSLVLSTVPNTGLMMFTERFRKAMSDPIKVILHVVTHAPGKFFFFLMGENKKECLFALLGLKIILLYFRYSSGYQALH